MGGVLRNPDEETAEEARAHAEVETHRGIRAEDLFELKRLEEARRRAMLDELTAEAEKLGLGY